METIKEINIAIISDLHCSSNKGKTIETYLYTDNLRKPNKHHPVEALNELIDKKPIKADFLLSPGDLTDKIDITGLNQGWSFLEEIARKLGCEEKIIATIGNHDFDSRNKLKEYTQPDFHLKNLKDNFPFKGEKSKFWQNNFQILEYDDISILNLNTVYSHSKEDINEDGTSNGYISKLDSNILESIEEEIKNIDKNKFKIALLHHHPILYSDLNLSSYSDNDVLRGGDMLLKILNKYNYNFVLHGHKHVPRFLIQENLPIFCSGSFSSLLNLQESNSRNTFHLLKLKIIKNKKIDEIKVGEIYTWEFKKGSGWNKPNDHESKLIHRIGFGLKIDLPEYKKQIIEYLIKENTNLITLEKLISIFPNIKYFNPTDIKEIFTDLKNILRYTKAINEEGSIIFVKV